MSPLNQFWRDIRNSIRPVRTLRFGRLWEVDSLRGVAIIMMVIYHLMWDLHGFAGYDIEMYSGFWHYFQLATASLFIGLVGVSLTLRYHAGQRKGRHSYASAARRGLVIFFWGLVVGVVTFLFDPARYVRFGILHFIGFAILVSYPLAGRAWFSGVLGVLILLFGRVAGLFAVDSPWLGWLGLDLTIRPALDYFPVIPWLGVALLGIWAGHLFFPHGKPRWRQPDKNDAGPLPLLQLAGQNALLIYLVHQPLLLLVLTLLGIVRL